MKHTSKSSTRKLSLHKDTLRQLTSKDLDRAAGGVPPDLGTTLWPVCGDSAGNRCDLWP